MRHVHTLKGNAWDPPCHINVRKGVGEEMPEPGEGGGPHMSGDGLTGLLNPTHIVIIIQIPGAGYEYVRRLLEGNRK